MEVKILRISLIYYLVFLGIPQFKPIHGQLQVDTCYSAPGTQCSTVNITCATGAVIAPAPNYLVKKPTPNACPAPAGDCENSCCVFQISDFDIEENYDFTDSADMISYVVSCLKQESCTAQSPYDNTLDFHYTLFPYTCIPETKVVEMPENTGPQTYNPDVTVFYSGASEPTPGVNCSCEVTSASSFSVYSIYTYLDQTTCPSVKFTTDGGANILSCSAEGAIYLGEDLISGSRFYIELNNLNASSENVVWLKFESDASADINVQCNGCSRTSTTPEIQTLTDSGCYTDTAPCSTVDISCPTNEVIAPSTNYLVKKRTPNSCPGSNTDCSNICCTYEQEDFADENNFEIPSNVDILNYVVECLKEPACTVTSPYDASLSFNYVLYPYSCLPVSKVIDMVDNIPETVFNGDVSIFYSAAREPTPGTNCSCRATSSSAMTVTTYYVFLDSTTCPKVTFVGSGGSLAACDADGLLSLEDDWGTSSDLYIELNNLNATPDNVLWVKLATDPADDISLSCFGCSLKTTTTTQPTTSTTKTSTSTASSSTTTQQTTTKATTTAPDSTSSAATESTTVTTNSETTLSTNAVTSVTSQYSTPISNSTTNTSYFSDLVDDNNTSTISPDPIAAQAGVSDDIVIAVSVSLGVLVFGVTATHVTLYILHKKKISKVQP